MLVVRHRTTIPLGPAHAAAADAGFLERRPRDRRDGGKLEVVALQLAGRVREGRDGGVLEAMAGYEPGDASTHAGRALGAAGLDRPGGRGFGWVLHDPSLPRAYPAPVQIAGTGIQIV
jgi:hypothetical protein